MKKALIIIDIQNDYFENGSMPLVGSDKACEKAKFVLDKFRSENMPVVHVKHVATRQTATFFLPDTTGAEIHKILQPLDNEKIIIKHYPNSFRETGLLDYLKENDVSDLVICGMMTHMCVDATVRAAKDFGFNITLIGDACATKNQEIMGKIVNAEDVQNSFLAALSYFYADVVNCQDLF